MASLPDDGILDEVRKAKDEAARLISDGLVMAHHLRKAVDLRWQLIRNMKVMSNGMRDLATHAPDPKPAEPPKTDG